MLLWFVHLPQGNAKHVARHKPLHFQLQVDLFISGAIDIESGLC